MATPPTIAMLWIGGSLTWLEHLCMKSFVDAGQPVTLYAYEPVGNVPAGVTVKDGEAILTGKTFYRHARNDSVAPFSDIFRFHLMLKAPGEIWCDTDIYCVKPIEPAGEHVFGYETPVQINSAVLRLPPDSAALRGMLDFMEDEFPIPPFLKPKVREDYRAAAEAGTPVHISEMPWGLWGPLGITHFLKETGEAKHARAVSAFYPVHYKDRNVFFKRPAKTLAHFTEETTTVHLWARIKRFAGMRHGGYAPKGSYLARLLEKHEVDQTKGRIVSHGHLKFDHAAFDAEVASAEG
ncbi:MAG: hypothetical protein AAGF90_05430 [Pseudomonadota bacterium]